MIYSGIQDNWERVQILHESARNAYNTRLEWQARGYIKEEIFPFSVEAYESQKKEMHFVEILMVWCVVTIESLINHAIAESIEKMADAIVAIDKPKWDRTHSKTNESSLSTKIRIICAQNHVTLPDNIIQITEKICSIRNNLVHDKPFWHEITEDPDVNIEHFSKKLRLQNYHYYDCLPNFLTDCDRVLLFMLHNSNLNLTFSICFYSLLS